MAEKCNPKYKNLQLISSFSEQRYATVQLMEQICQNDEYLKQYCDQLDYLSPPAVRKRFNITEDIDENKSYGYQLNSNKTVTFNNKDKTVIDIDFFDESLIDMDVSDCVIKSAENNNGEPVRYACLPYVTTSSTTDTTSTANLPEAGGKVSSYWYVGYDKSKTYTLYPEWMRNWKDYKIPSVVRAQTFKCNKTGVLDAVSLEIATDSKYSSWGSPIYVQIWPTKTRKNVQVSGWNYKTKSSEPVYITAPAGTTAQKYRKITSGKNKGKWKKDNTNGTHIRQTEDLIKPKSKLSNGSSMTYHPLAEASFDPKFSTPGFHTFEFDNPCNVVKDKYYAIVVFSPLSHWGQAPRIGGWTRSSKHDYANGNAFISENNGRTFMKYGKNDPTIKYKMGKYEPQDFAFQCHITTHTEGYQPLVTKDANNEDITAYSYLYFKPIFTNPIKSIEINATDTGTTTVDHNAGRYLEYQYSLTGNRSNDSEWTTLPKANRSAISGKPTMIFVRAKMWQTSTNNTQTPSIEYMSIRLETDVSKEMYVRTQTYYPKSTPMLGANIWGRVHTPFECETDEVTCGAEIIQEKIIKEHFEIITVDDLEDYTYLDVIKEEDIKNKDSDELCQFLIDNPNIIKTLKENNIYVKPYIFEAEEDDGDDTIVYLSFDDTNELGTFKLGGFQFTNSPSYPIISCKTLPTSGVSQAYGEWFDYTVDYDQDTLTLTEHNLMNLPVGGLEVEYNKLFIDNLQPAELPLVLDYFKEEFLISDQEIENKYVTIRVDAVDPIRHVIVNKDTDNEIELVEDEDFTVDYINNRVHFLVINKDDNKAKIRLNDTVTIVYTPNLDDTGISIGYFARRPDSALKRQCKIYPNYIEYKV